MTVLLDTDPPEGVVECIPTYRSLLLVYDPEVTGPERLQAQLLAREAGMSAVSIPEPATVDIPVCYGGRFGPDIDAVASAHGLTEQAVVRIHSERVYPIYMIGFTPGFPFLGGLAEILHTPRLQSPRTRVPEGSVGIANNQTGIYPVASPGGWQLIGRTPLRLFAPERKNPFLFKAGDHIRFRPIDAAEYAHLLERSE